MHVSIYVLLLLFSVVCQLLIAPLFSIKEVSPDFLLIIIIFISIQKGRAWGVWSGFLAGLVLDLLGTGIVGLSSLTKSLSAYVSGSLVGERVERRFAVNIGLLCTVLIIHDLIYFLILNIGISMGFLGIMFKHVVPTSIYTISFVIILYLIRPAVFRRASSIKT